MRAHAFDKFLHADDDGFGRFALREVVDAFEQDQVGDACETERVAFEPLHDGERLHVAGTDLQVIHTPGHAPGGVCLWSADLGVLLSGDTLFHGGPGATGRSFSDFPTILDSIRERLLTLPPGTRVLTGHGDETEIATEAADYDAWVARGH